MASSGRVHPAIIKLMATTIQVASKTGSDRYGSPTFGANRDVTCMRQPSTKTTWGIDGTPTTTTVALYCDDIDIQPEDRLTIAGDMVYVDSIDTFEDEYGPTYQVVRYS